MKKYIKNKPPTYCKPKFMPRKSPGRNSRPRRWYLK